MKTIFMMCLGIIIGKYWFPLKWSNHNSIAQIFLTIFLIFAMGIALGNNENLLEHLGSIGFYSLLFCLIPMSASFLLVYLMTKRSFEKKKVTK